jgi:hypothetical protein
VFDAQADSHTPSFGRDVLPLLADRCFACHGPEEGQRKADLRLDLEEGAKASAVVPGDPEASELLKRITTSDSDDVMPPPDSNKKPLTELEIETIRAWIADGAPWAKHWAFEAPTTPELPAVSKSDWARTPMDHFVLERLKVEGLVPSAEADPETLVRRVALDVTGLPPDLETVDSFLADPSDAAYVELVDRYLASSAYGENMARDWLDGARYADTNGFQNDFRRTMWPWRDWVIDAYNANMPFDQFVIEQLAGDILPDATESQRIATGFNRNNKANTEGGSIEAEWRVENIVDRVQTTSEVFMGLSMGCGRCHDHKYDPISQREFYSFFAFFNSTEDRGFYEETRGNTGPLVSLAGLEHQLRILELDTEVGAVKQKLDDAAKAKPAAYEAWLANLNDAPAGASEPELSVAFNGSLAGATISGEPAFEDGLLGSALMLDGTAESTVSVTNAKPFDAAQPFTVSLWARPESGGALVSTSDSDAQFRGVDVLIDDRRRVQVNVSHAVGKNGLQVRTDERVRMGTWMHVVVTYDGSGKAEGLAVYAGGVPANTNAEQDHLTESIHSDAPLLLGGRAGGSHLKGAIARFDRFDRALSAEEVEALSRGAIAATQPPEPSDGYLKLLHDYFDLRYSYFSIAERDALKTKERERRDYKRISVPSVMIMRELPEPRPTYRLVRGAYDAPDTSEVLEPGVPAFLPPMPEGAPPNRLGLAQWLVDPNHPLTARVAVNRLWQMYFGRGFVETEEDFGIQGAAPTHPQLLDWLATEFVASGWDVKALQKRILMSATYRQSSTVSPGLIERDPENLLLARAPRYRLPAEVVRDNALAVSGLLTARIGGPPVKPYQPDGLWEELAGGAGEGPYQTASGDDLYRRSMYTYRKRTVPPPSMTTFDTPLWEICQVRRGRTNTPLQALALLNDVTYVEAARHLAQRIVSEAGTDVAERLTHGFRLATGRQPTLSELGTLATGLDGYLETYRNDPDAAVALIANGESPVTAEVEPVELAAYTSLAGVILNLDETITRE